jgi:hypothetical protein
MLYLLCTHLFSYHEYLNLFHLVPPDPPKNIVFEGVNSTEVKIAWNKGFNGNSMITGYILKYSFDTKSKELRLPGSQNYYIINNVESNKKYSFVMKAINDIGSGNFSKEEHMRFMEGG